MDDNVVNRLSDFEPAPGNTVEENRLLQILDHVVCGLDALAGEVDEGLAGDLRGLSRSLYLGVEALESRLSPLETDGDVLGGAPRDCDQLVGLMSLAVSSCTTVLRARSRAAAEVSGLRWLLRTGQGMIVAQCGELSYLAGKGVRS
jgi:hypothetical protein